MLRAGTLLLVLSASLTISTSRDVLADSFGSLAAQSKNTTCTPLPGRFAAGQEVDLVGAGFAASTSVSIDVRWSPSATRSLGSATSTASGVLSTDVSLPSDIPVGTYFVITASGDDASSGMRSLTALALAGPAYSVNSDGDNVPDICDNCPSTKNGAQDDADGHWRQVRRLPRRS